MWKTIVTNVSKGGGHWRHGALALHPAAFRYVSMRLVLTRRHRVSITSTWPLSSQSCSLISLNVVLVIVTSIDLVFVIAPWCQHCSIHSTIHHRCPCHCSIHRCHRVSITSTLAIVVAGRERTLCQASMCDFDSNVAARRSAARRPSASCPVKTAPCTRG